MAKKESPAKEPVRIRRKRLNNGGESLYLDIYRDGKRSYRFLKLYLRPELTKEDTELNSKALAAAESLKMEELRKIHAGMMGIPEKKADDMTLYEYLERVIARKEGTTKTSWKNCREHLRIYHPEDIRIDAIDRQWVQGFRDYLDSRAMQWAIDTRKRECDPKPISPGTKRLMFQKFCSLLHIAQKEEYIDRDPSAAVKRFGEPESERGFLTVEELRRLKDVPAPDPEVGRAFLFSCLTGLRWSDIAALRWGEVQRLGESTRLVFWQKKTGGLEYLDINTQAVRLLGDRGKEKDLVFPGLTAVQTARIMVGAWVKAAGIDKHITFHCGRHTFAIMMLELGTDLYTLSKLMGHRSIESTQVYAKILDKTKQAAVARIPDIL